MEKIKITTPFIKLDQLIKLAGLVSSGSDAKIDIQDGKVKVNGIVEIRRGRKLFVNDKIEYKGIDIILE